MTDPTRKKLPFYSVRTKKTHEYPVEKVETTKRGGKYAVAHDEAGRKVTRFVGKDYKA